MESRYTNRFRTIGESSGQHLKNVDSAGNVTEHLSLARGSIQAQQENIKDLFATAMEMITGVNTHQSMLGTELVKNIPLPSDKIKGTYGNQLGYVQLSLRFLQAGLLHFMDQTCDAQHRISQLEKFVENIAAYDSEVSLVGRMNNIDIDSLEADLNTQSVPLSVTTPPPTPPHTDVKPSGSPTSTKAGPKKEGQKKTTTK